MVMMMKWDESHTTEDREREREAYHHPRPGRERRIFFPGIDRIFSCSVTFGKMDLETDPIIRLETYRCDKIIRKSFSHRIRDPPWNIIREEGILSTLHLLDS